MKNNKGFTLIEAIAVTMLLAMLALIIIPTVLNQRRKQEKKIKEQQKKIMYIEAERYLKENNLVEASSTKCIPVTFLEKEGYINLNTTTYDSQYIKLIIDEDENIESSLVNTCSDQVINKVTVTFDANGGTVDTTTKEVLVGKKYGDLPKPTRSGYTFKGWNGKNKLPELNAEDYIFSHFSSRTSHEFKTENGREYIKIKGNSSTANIDTCWWFASKRSIALSANSTYYLSFDVRSKNAGTSQFICKRRYNADGKTGLYSTLNLQPSEFISSIDEDKIFNNDGDWHRISSPINVPTGVSSGFLAIGNDQPNIYGTNSYIDITNIQLEEGNKATEYEPYYVTKNTKVTQTGNHTLKAIWEAN